MKTYSDTIALELARKNPVYEDIATKFFEHFLHIAKAMCAMGEDGAGVWDDEDGFFYDVLRLPGAQGREKGSVFRFGSRRLDLIHAKPSPRGVRTL